ncbi:uncharacterized protein LOC144928058 [Branchiostoma floridae x Branchiostoma belcheri]
MAGPVQEFQGLNDADRRHFDFMQTLLRISEELSDDETANFKLFCMHLIPKSKSEKLRRAVDVFVVLIELCKIDQENLDFLKEILERIGRWDLVRDFLIPFQPPDRMIPEDPNLQPGTSEERAATDGATTVDNIYLVINGQRHMIQETIDHHRHNIAAMCCTRQSQVKFRGYKKGRSILVHYTIPREHTSLLRLMANLSDTRIVYMGVKSLQINTEVPIEVTRRTLLYDVKRQLPVDDIEVGCSTRTKQQRAPKSWTRLSALNLFSDTLPLYLQVAESLEYQGFSYSLVQALVQKDQLREHQNKQLIQNLKKTEVDSKTFMTMRSKLIITENRLKDALETITVLEKELQRAREDAEKAKQVRSHVIEYTGEKPPGGWSSQVEKADVATQLPEEVDNAEGSTATPELDDVGKQEPTAVQKSTPAGEEQIAVDVVTYDGRGSGCKLKNPRGVAVSPSNEIFVTDTGNKLVQVSTMHGNCHRHFPTVVPGTGGKLMEPHDVSVDDDYTLWVVGRGKAADYVVRYGMDGALVSKIVLPKVGDYRGIALDPRNNEHILVTEASQTHCGVKVFSQDGGLVREFRHPNCGMRLPEYITVDKDGNILLTDSTTHAVYIFDEYGKFLFKFGAKGSQTGQLLYPNGICTDNSGNIIVADCRNSRVQIFTSDGVYIRHINNHGHWAEGVATGPGGHLVVTNFYNDTVTIYASY